MKILYIFLIEINILIRYLTICTCVREFVICVLQLQIHQSTVQFLFITLSI